MDSQSIWESYAHFPNGVQDGFIAQVVDFVVTGPLMIVGLNAL